MPTGTLARIATGAASLFLGRRKAFWAAALLTLAADQWTKFSYAWPHCPPGRTRVLIPGVLTFVSHEANPCGIFGLGPNRPLFYIVATALGVLIILYFLANSDQKRWWPSVALGLICGGAFGNLVDRLAFNAVRDFIKMALWPFAYNVADAAICIGIGILLVEALLRGEEARDENQAQKAANT